MQSIDIVHIKAVHTLFLLLFLARTTFAWHAGEYNVNISHGLPSSHVYSGLVDRYGYLWVCTPKGVARYNGYEMKLYNVLDGLANNDVWGLFLDKKNRVWVHSIANEIGYIRNGQYKAAYTTRKNQVYYPHHITDYPGGVMFIADEFVHEHSQIAATSQLAIEKNDTIYFKDVGDNLKGKMLKINNRNNIVSLSEDSSYLMKYDARGLRLLQGCLFSRNYVSAPNIFNVYFNEYLLYYEEGKNMLKSFNIEACRERKFHLYTPAGEPDDIYSDFRYGDSYYVIAHRNIYRFDKNLNIVDTIPVNELNTTDKTLSAKNILYYFHDPLWGAVTFTDINGLHIATGVADEFTRLTTPALRNYTYAGSINSLSCWWNDNTRQLLTIDTSGSVREYNKDNWEHVTGVVQYGGKSFLLTRVRLDWLDTNNFVSIPVSQTHNILSGSQKKGDVMAGTLPTVIKQMTKTDENSFYVVSPQGIEKLYFADDKIFVEPVVAGRYNGIERDKIRNCLWAYNNNQVICITGDKRINIDNDNLKTLGIDHIERIQVDTMYGNLLLNDGNNIYLVDPERKKRRRLFPKFNIKDNKFCIAGNTVVCVGKFGILFSRIMGPGIFSEAVMYPNFKMTAYNSLHDISVTGRKVFLKTDNGMLQASFPGMKEYEQAGKNKQRYNVILAYNDSLYKIGRDMTLNIAQEQRNVKLDIINPLGVGKPKYYCKIPGWDDIYTALDNNEIFLPSLKPGTEYELWIMAEDDVWRSNVARVKLFVTPYWWQRNEWQGILWTFGVALLALFIYGISVATRRNVLKKNAKKNELLELELRAVYAQINPHFIFNTLNSALFFIRKNKMEEAYEHILRFSGLLRGYLETSRKRYISVADEVTNLQHYIELQQTRFGGLFAYRIELKDIKDAQRLFIPSLLLQPSVENAINHGLLPKERDGLLLVTIKRDEATGAITCIIDDNGIGRNRSYELNMQNTYRKASQGSQLLKQLTDVFNKYENAGIEIHYVDKQMPESGTIVIIKIKNPYNEK